MLCKYPLDVIWIEETLLRIIVVLLWLTHRAHPANMVVLNAAAQI